MSAKDYQMWVYAQNNPGVSQLDGVRDSAPPPPPPAPALMETTQVERSGSKVQDEDDEEMMQALAAEEEEIRRELAEFNRRQTSGEAATEETLEILTKAGIVPPAGEPAKPVTLPKEASTAAAAPAAAGGAGVRRATPRRSQVVCTDADVCWRNFYHLDDLFFVLALRSRQ